MSQQKQPRKEKKDNSRGKYDTLTVVNNQPFWEVAVVSVCGGREAFVVYIVCVIELPRKLELTQSMFRYISERNGVILTRRTYVYT